MRRSVSNVMAVWKLIDRSHSTRCCVFRQVKYLSIFHTLALVLSIFHESSNDQINTVSIASRITGRRSHGRSTIGLSNLLIFEFLRQSVFKRYLDTRLTLWKRKATYLLDIIAGYIKMYQLRRYVTFQ